MILEVNTHVVYCDLCDESLFDPAIDGNSAEQIAEFAEKDGWLVTDERCLCPSCRREDARRRQRELDAELAAIG